MQHTASGPHPLARLGVVVVAAGRGERLGAGVPKAFVSLGGRSLLEYAIRTITHLPEGGHLVLVVPADRAAEVLDTVAGNAVLEDSLQDRGWFVSVVAGGRERHESVRFGIDALHPAIDVVLVHDAARPLASAALFERVAAEVRRLRAAVVPGLPVADTLKRVGADGIVHETVSRADLVAVQTPQGFPRELLEAAHVGLRERAADSDVAIAGGESFVPTDDAEVVQQAGGHVHIVAGETRAHKLTTPDDLILLEALLLAAGADDDYNVAYDDDETGANR